MGVEVQADQRAMARTALGLVGAGKVPGGKDSTLPWLLIYDNVPNPDGLVSRDSKGEYRHSWLPAGSARVLITSRWEDFTGVAETKSLDVWSEATTAAFLLDATGREDREGAEALAAVIGGLPLAADQAAAFLRGRAGISFAQYARNIERLIDQAPDAGNLGVYGRTVYATLTTSLAELPEATRDLLCLLSWLSEDGTEVELLLAAARARPELLHDRLVAVLADDLAREDAIKRAVDFALIRRAKDDAGMDMLIVHRVTALVLRMWQTREGVAGWDDVAARLVGTLFPFDSDEPKYWTICARLLPHANALAHRGPEAGAAGRSRDRALNQAAGYLNERGDLEGATHLLEASLALSARIYGEESTDYATTLANLGDRYRAAGKLDEAEAALLRVIDIQSRASNPTQASIVQSHHTLGGIYSHMGDFAQAEAYFVKVHEAVRDQAAENAIITGALGVLYDRWSKEPGQSHRSAAAERLKREAIGLARAALGERHPRVSVFLSNLGVTLATNEDFVAAGELALRGLAIRMSLGLLDHPDTRMLFDDLLLYRVRSGQEASSDELMQELAAEILEVERLMREWVAEEPGNRDFGPPPFEVHKGQL